MITEILSIITSSGFGAILGVFGSYLTRKEERKKQKQEHDFQLEMAKINLEESKRDRDHEIAIADKERKHAETDGEIATELIDAESFKESIISGRTKSGIKIIDGLQKVMRLVITSFLLIFVATLTFDIAETIGGLEAIDNAELVELYVKIISDILFLTMVAVGWYFGKRATNKQ